jgi:hypothetical protein
MAWQSRLLEMHSKGFSKNIGSGPTWDTIEFPIKEKLFFFTT